MQRYIYYNKTQIFQVWYDEGFLLKKPHIFCTFFKVLENSIEATQYEMYYVYEKNVWKFSQIRVHGLPQIRPVHPFHLSFHHVPCLLQVQLYHDLGQLALLKLPICLCLHLQFL